MTIAASLVRLRRLALSFPRTGCDWEQRPRFDPPASANSVADFESLAGFRFPSDFRAFLAATDAIVAMGVHNGIWLGGVMELSRSFEREDFPRLADNESAVPVATDGGGNAFLLGASGRVWQWNRETGKVTSMANTFGDFLQRVADDWEAYISDKPGWRYLI